MTLGGTIAGLTILEKVEGLASSAATDGESSAAGNQPALFHRMSHKRLQVGAPCGCTTPICWSGSTREIKRCTRVVGIFPKEAAITRQVGAIPAEQNEEWARSEGKYITLDTQLASSYNDLFKLPSVAT